jgi:hypothetical protein
LKREEAMEDSPEIVFDAAPLSEAEDQDKAYWLSMTPTERLQALELMRRLEYGYEATTARIDKTKFEVIRLEDLK